MAVFFWMIFAIDLEKDRDFWTWMWLLNSILQLLIWTLSEIKIAINNATRNTDPTQKIFGK
jgi:hypothetical protein